MSRPRIKTALISVFVLIGLLFGGFAAYSVNRLQATNKFVADLGNNWMPSIALAKSMELDLANLRVAYRDHLIALDVAETDKAGERITAFAANFLDHTTAYEAIVTYPIELEITKQARASFATYTELGKTLTDLSSQERDDEARLLMAEQMLPAANSVTEMVDKLIEINETGAKDSIQAGQDVFSTTLTLTFVAIGLSMTVIAGSIWFAFVGIAKPIEAITGAMKTLAAGDTKTAIPFAGRADEVGEMAAAVEVFRTNAETSKQLATEAATALATVEDVRRRQAESDSLTAAQMAQATAGLGEGLKHMADGDLTYQLTQAFAPQFDGLRTDFNSAVSQLAETLQAVATASGAIDSGTREISSSAEDLSKRTEQQAASLEETAAALDQITSNVSNSSKRAEEARVVAVQANQSAAHSGTVVASAVQAMHKIEQSSSQVSNIIGVIDEIAFQTNLLALNAGVEAARAGDAGKGFAVVAQEVRELAQRSAQAAKEIKELIRNSSSEVQSGAKLVTETGEALKTIETYIVTINQHMDAIATSAREQSTGLAEVNTAVNQMDQVTQQNAAMVEESNAACATLASEAGRLRDLLRQFQLGGNSSRGQAEALRHTAAAMASPRSTARPQAAYRPAQRGNTAVKQEEWSEF